MNGYVTVHETTVVPPYSPIWMAFPGVVNLYYVEIEPNKENIPRQFRPSRLYIANPQRSSLPEFPSPIVIDDHFPAHVGIRLNAKIEGMYLVSIEIEVSAGTEREIISVVSPQWIIFENPPVPDL